MGSSAYRWRLDPVPEFGAGVATRADPCSPRELYRAVFVDLEDSVHFLPPAFEFVRDALARAEVPGLDGSCPREVSAALIDWARQSLPARRSATPELSRIVSEFAPVGLSDGAWLRGAMLSNAVESEVGMSLLKQLMLRFGGPGVHEAYVQRYAALLRSMGGAPGPIVRCEGGQQATCTDVAYEHALLGLCLGLFPTTLEPETLGFNLWMAAIGPCPLLEAVSSDLRAAGANLRYLELHDRATMRGLAERAIEHCVAAGGVGRRVELIERVAAGFAAGHASYQRWESALQHVARASATGVYAAPQDPSELEAFAFERYGELENPELYHCFANVDLHPSVRIVAREYAGAVFARIAQVFERDERLNSRIAPAYSERTIAEIVARQHDKNVRSRGQPSTSMASSNSEEAIKGIQEVFDGCWLQGFVDVQRADFEEYGWLFRIYASEHGDGDFAWNHCQIFRRAFAQLGPEVMLPKTDPRLYGLFEIGFAAMATLAVSLNTRRYMPEILGINLGIESTGVGGSYMDQWKSAEKEGNPWRALAWRLHNSIDNYADGHTKWSLAAVQSFMRRVKDGEPSEVPAQWERVWRLWRCRDILVHGTEAEQAALDEHFEPGSQVLAESA